MSEGYFIGEAIMHEFLVKFSMLLNKIWQVMANS